MFTAIGVILVVALTYALVKKLVINPLLDDIEKWQDRRDRRATKKEKKN